MVMVTFSIQIYYVRINVFSLETIVKNLKLRYQMVRVCFINMAVPHILLILVIILILLHQLRLHHLNNQAFALIRIFITESIIRPSEMLVAS